MLKEGPHPNKIKRRYEDVKRQFQVSQEAHEKYIRTIENGEEFDGEQEDKWIGDVPKRFYKLEEQMDSVLDDLSEKSRRHKDEKPKISLVPEESKNVQLERMKFQNFNGDIRKYPKFRDEFIRYIEPLCKREQMPFVLKSYLTEEVRDEVENVGEDIEAIWRRLDKKYGNEDKLIDKILSDVKGLPHNDNDDQINMHSDSL